MELARAGLVLVANWPMLASARMNLPHHTYLGISKKIQIRVLRKFLVVYTSVEGIILMTSLSIRDSKPRKPPTAARSTICHAINARLYEDDTC